ncbi:hypothetical protein GJ744_007138 [Endocarpon pusillum]|uniref:Uncharacterized protein n=1 Tax=Endocarpon pusillum TaxID=364733 RepID=A0A8H7AMD0_9EURO|nr:hypothetical protein GJ744_007138 [Endocarpon pusillum]
MASNHSDELAQSARHQSTPSAGPSSNEWGGIWLRILRISRLLEILRLAQPAATQSPRHQPAPSAGPSSNERGSIDLDPLSAATQSPRHQPTPSAGPSSNERGSIELDPQPAATQSPRHQPTLSAGPSPSERGSIDLDPPSTATESLATGVNQPATPPPQPAPNPQPGQNTRKEWKSWKIQWPWLSFLLFIVLSLISIVAVLEVVSRKNSGFVRQGNPPAFLARRPALEKAIWTQGILYTAFPTFIMTLYRTVWETAIAAFAERQPYIDLNTSTGAPPRSTIMLDYRSEPFIYSWWAALRNKHFLLAACMFMSMVLAILTVPLTSFLFTTADYASNTTFPLSFETSFDSNVIGEPFDFPDLRLPLDSAAAMRIQDASRPPWTDGEYAFAKFVPQEEVGDGTVTLETTGYSAHSDCRYIPESQYQKTILTPNETGIPALSIGINADDRGCQISHFINLGLSTDHPVIMLMVWPTTSCSADARWSRFSILTAHYTDASASVTNFSLISCVPSYQITPGTLVATIGSTPPSVRTFSPQPSNTSQFRPDALWRFFETEIQAPSCLDPMTNVRSNEFGLYVYKIASKKNPASPLLPETIIDAAEMLFTTTFAVFASTVLFKPTSSPLNGIGTHSVQETRVVVVSPVAYFILGVLVTIAVLNMSLFFYARQESMLCEEPVGLISIAGILHNSDVNAMVEGLVGDRSFKGKTREAAKRVDKFNQRCYRFDKTEKRIVSVGGNQI